MGPCADAPSGRDQAPKWELPAHLASRMHLCEIMAWIARGRPVIGAARDMEKGTPVGDAHRAKNKVPALEGARTQRSKVFKRPFFPLPTGQGEVILNAQSEFSLSKTLLQEVASSKLRSIPSPDPYHKIRTNIFVERRPRKSGEAPVCDCVPPANGGPGCAENCLNRLLLYECPAKLCPCGEQCTNQRLQRRERVTHLEVFWTGARGHGLRTLVPIRAGALVVEYCGEVISQQEMQRRADTVYRGKKNLYFLQYGPGEILDAGVKGTEARFLNHSCDPNCHIEKWSVDEGEYRVGVFASRDIARGAELSYDYKYENFPGAAQQRCRCGSENCRGVIGPGKSDPKSPPPAAAVAGARRPGAGKEPGGLGTRVVPGRLTLGERRSKGAQGKWILNNAAFLREHRTFLIRNVRSVDLKHTIRDSRARGTQVAVVALKAFRQRWRLTPEEDEL